MLTRISQEFHYNRTMHYVDLPFVRDLAGFGWSFMCCSNMDRISAKAWQMFSENRCTFWNWIRVSLWSLILIDRVTYGLRTRGLCWDMEEYQIFTSYDVRDTVAIVCNGSKATAGTDTVRVLLQIHLRRLTMWCLTSGQTPGFAQYLVKEGRIHL